MSVVFTVLLTYLLTGRWWWAPSDWRVLHTISRTVGLMRINCRRTSSLI